MKNREAVLGDAVTEEPLKALDELFAGIELCQAFSGVAEDYLDSEDMKLARYCCDCIVNAMVERVKVALPERASVLNLRHPFSLDFHNEAMDALIEAIPLKNAN